MPYTKEEKSEYDKRRYLENMKKKKQHNREYYLKNKERINERSKQWRANHPNYYRKREWKEYNKVRVRERTWKWKLFLMEKLGGKCNRCPETHLVCLEFHHINPENKEQEREWRRKDFRIKVNAGEIMLLCSNCHKKEHNPDTLEYIETLIRDSEDI